MSIKTVSSSNIAPRDIPAPVFPVVTNPASLTTWTRPGDWLTLPTVTSTDQKFAGLLAITNDTTNYIALSATVSAGTYTVDWGDGSATQTFASGATAQKVFDYASISAATTTTQGFRQTIITVTATTGNLTGVNLQVKYVNVPALGAYAAKWLDIIVGSPNMTSMTVGAVTLIVGMSWLQQYKLMSTASTFTTLTFNGCSRLQSVPTLNFSNITLNTYNGLGFFQGCSSLQVAPSIDCTKFSSMSQFFYNCQNLRSVPNYSTSTNNTNCSNMFFQCYNLRSIEALDVSKVTTTLSMFGGCTSLTTLPPLNFSTLLTITTTMFDGCFSLQSVPLFNTINVTNTQNMFRSCASLRSVPLYNLANSVTVDGMFSTCSNLQSAPAFNFSKATSFANMFNACRNLQSTGAFTTTSALLSVLSMFNSCNRLTSVGLFNTVGVTAFDTWFYLCGSLTTLPAFDYTAGLTFTSTFNGCSSLLTMPAMNTGNATSCTNMFNGCYSLQSITSIDTTKCTNHNSMFLNCRSLITAPSLNLSNTLTCYSLFQGCNQLTSVSSLTTQPKNAYTAAMFQDCYNLTIANISTNAFVFTSNTLDSTSMFQNCISITSIPDITGANTIATIPNMFSGMSALSAVGNINLNNSSSQANLFLNCNTLANLNISNINNPISVASTLLSKTSMENVFSNLKNNFAYTITINNTPAASAAVSLNGTWNNASNIVTMTNTTGLIVGMTCTSANLSGNVSITTYANSKLSANNLASANNMIRVYAATGGLAANTPYYLSNASGTSPTYYDVSNVAGGTPLTLTAAGPANAQFDVKIATINTNANIIISAWPNGNATTTAISSRNLNTNLATFKSWTIAG